MNFNLITVMKGNTLLNHLSVIVDKFCVNIWEKEFSDKMV